MPTLTLSFHLNHTPSEQSPDAYANAEFASAAGPRAVEPRLMDFIRHGRMGFMYDAAYSLKTRFICAWALRRGELSVKKSNTN